MCMIAEQAPMARVARFGMGLWREPTKIRQAVGRLPEDQRLVFVLSENQGLRYADIAEVLEIPVGTVKSRMHAAVRRLRDLLKDVQDAL